MGHDVDQEIATRVSRDVRRVFFDRTLLFRIRIPAGELPYPSSMLISIHTTYVIAGSCNIDFNIRFHGFYLVWPRRRLSVVCVGTLDFPPAPRNKMA